MYLSLLNALEQRKFIFYESDHVELKVSMAGARGNSCSIRSTRPSETSAGAAMMLSKKVARSQSLSAVGSGPNHARPFS